MEKRSDVMSLIWKVLCPVLLYELVVSMMYAVMRHTQTEIFFLGESLYMQARATGALLTLPVLIYWYRYARLQRKMEREEAGLQPEAGPRMWNATAGVFLVLMAAGYSMLANMLVFLLSYLAGMGGSPSAGLGVMSAFFRRLLLMGVLLPLEEELIFRGLGYFPMRQQMPLWASVWITAAWFALYHGNLKQGIYALLGGVFLALIYEIYDNLLAVWLFHMALNITALFMEQRHFYLFLMERTMLVRTCLLGMIMGGLFLGAGIYKLRKDGQQRETIIHSNTLL